MVPTFTTSSIGQIGAQLYSGSIATPTPQAFNVASPPAVKPGYGVDGDHLTVDGRHALHTGPDPPDSSRHRGNGASITGSLALHLLTSLDRPAPSGGANASCRCRGCFPPSPAFPGSGLPPATPNRCDDPVEKDLSPPHDDSRLVAHLTVTVYDDEIAALAADDADLPAGRLTVSAPRIQGFRAWSARRWTPPTQLRFVTGAVS